MAHRRCSAAWLVLAGAAGAVGAACSTPPATDAAPAPRVTFQAPRVHGLLNFVQTIQGDAHRSPILKELFEQSEFDNPTNASHLEDFDQARKNLTYGVMFDGYPVERRAGRNLSQLFLIQSGFARDLDDLRGRTLGMLPQSEHTRIFDSLAALEPVYDELVWKPHHRALERYRQRIADRAREWKIEHLFEAALTFYRSDWPDSMSFTVALYPLPGAKGATSAESIGSFESVGVLIDEQDLASRFGVIFHEMCHSLYEAQPPAVQHELERWFTESPSRHARLAYQQLNEGLATALGNGWAYARASGREETGDWYNDERVDRLAKGIYPLVTRYLDEHRAIDAEFAAQAIALFESVFPEAIYEYDLLLNRILLMVDGTKMQGEQVVDALRRHYRVSSVSTSSPIDHERSLATVRTSGETLVVVVADEHKEQLAALARIYPPVAEKLDELLGEQRDYLYAGVDTNGRGWVIVKARDREGLSRAVELMHSRGRIDPRTPLTVLED